MAPAAFAQNGFPAPKAAVDQYDPPPPANSNGQGQGPSGAQGQGPGSNNGRPSRGGEASVPKGTSNRRKSCNTGRARAAQRNTCPSGGAGPDSASGRNGVGGVKDERGGALPFSKSQGGKLPFTGLDLWLLVSLGMVLLAGGFGFRAAARPRKTAV